MRIQEILDSAKEETEDNLTGAEVVEMGYEDLKEYDSSSDEELKGEGKRLKGKCPECSSRRLRVRQGRERAEIYCKDCDEELLKYHGSGTVTGVNFYEEVGGHSISFAKTG